MLGLKLSPVSAQTEMGDWASEPMHGTIVGNLLYQILPHMHHPLMPEYINTVVGQDWVEQFDHVDYSSCAVRLVAYWPDQIYQEYTVYPYNYSPALQWDSTQTKPHSYVLHVVQNIESTATEELYQDMPLGSLLMQMRSLLYERFQSDSQLREDPPGFVMKDLAIETEEARSAGRFVLLRLTGAVTIRTAPALRKRLEDLIQAGQKRFIVDCENIECMRESDVFFLASLRKMIATNEGETLICSTGQLPLGNLSNLGYFPQEIKSSAEEAGAWFDEVPLVKSFPRLLRCPFCSCVKEAKTFGKVRCIACKRRFGINAEGKACMLVRKRGDRWILVSGTT
jgi:anti-anti-sigma regulatory factor